MQYLHQNISFSAAAKGERLPGKVVVSFVVERDGSFTDIKLTKDLGSGTGKAVVRVVEAMPRWVPAMKDGKAVRSDYVLPVSFN